MAGPTTNVQEFGSGVESSLVFHKNTDLFKRAGMSWEFFFRNTEVVRDVQALKFGEHGGLFIISDNKITKWTNFVPAKRVYLKVRDRAGNESDPSALECSIVTLDLQSIKEYVPSGRILDVDEYGTITYSFDSINNRLFYGGDLLDTEIGIYESEIFNGSNDLVSWRSITWESTEPTGTLVSLQIRSGISEDDILDQDWSEDLLKNSQGFVSMEFVQGQFLQFRAVLRSTVRDISPTLHSVTIRNLTAAATHFFTTNFILPKRAISGILTENSIIPVSADIVFGINTKNSVAFSDYQIIEPNRIFTTDAKQFGENLRIGVKIITPGITSPVSQDSYEEFSYSCQINFDFLNTDTTTKSFHFRVVFYNDVQRIQEAYSLFSGNDQTGWHYGNNIVFPAGGLSIPADSTRSILFEPGDAIPSGQIYYLVIEAFDGTSFEDVKLHDSYTCNTSVDPYDEYGVAVPILKNLAIIFSLEDGETVKINAT